jgi:hypothetical protein
MTEYILSTDVEHLLGILEPRSEPAAFERLRAEIPGKQFWLKVPDQGCRQTARMFYALDKFRNSVRGIGNLGTQWFYDSLVEQAHLLRGSEQPVMYGKQDDDVTAFGEWNGGLAYAVQNGETAYVRFLDGMSEWGHGKITSIGEGPDNHLVTILNKALYCGREQVTPEGARAASIKLLPGGEGLTSPFMFDGKLTYIMQKTNPKKPRSQLYPDHGSDELYLVHGKKTIHIKEGLDALAVEIDELAHDELGMATSCKIVKFTKRRRKKVLAKMVTTGTLQNELYSWSRITPGFYLPHPEYARMHVAESGTDIPRVRQRNVIAGQITDMIVYQRPEWLIQDCPTGGMIVHDPEMPRKHVLLQHPRSLPVYKGTTLTALTGWAQENLTLPLFQEVLPAINSVPVRNLDDLTFLNCLAAIQQFSEQCLDSDHQSRLKKCFGE